jgi:hypothetical protein
MSWWWVILAFPCGDGAVFATCWDLLVTDVNKWLMLTGKPLFFPAPSKYEAQSLQCKFHHGLCNVQIATGDPQSCPAHVHETKRV